MNANMYVGGLVEWEFEERVKWNRQAVFNHSSFFNLSVWLMGHGWCSCGRLPPPGPFFKDQIPLKCLIPLKKPNGA